MSDLLTFVCDGCLSTYTGKPHELDKLGWQRKPLKRKREFLLCRDCIRHYDPIWHPVKAA